MTTTSKDNKDSKDYLDAPVTRREFRSNLLKWTVVVASSFLLLSGGLFWALSSSVQKSKEDIIDNAVSICERGTPVRVATNKNSEATKIVSQNTSKFLRELALLPTTVPKSRVILLKLSKNYDDVATTSIKVPIIDCETQYRASLEK